MTNARSLLFGALFLCATAQAQPLPLAAAIASPHPQATAAGQQILDEGGNAFDAAVAVSATLAVVEPFAAGLGGGGYFLLRQAGNPTAYHFIDAREKAPLAARPDMYLRDGKEQPGLSINGPLASAIPGLPDALVELASHYGALPLKDSLAPAIRLANQGFAVDHVYRAWATARLATMRDNPETARLFLSNGEVPAVGQLLRQPELAQTLTRLADQGRDGYYAGPTAQALVKAVHDGGGLWTLKDLADYHVANRAPLRFALADHRELISAPPPSAGGIALAQSLAMLQQLPWRQADPMQRVHYVVEVLRRAYRDRSQLGDPDFITNPVQALLAPDYLKAMAASIDPHQATASADLPPAPAWREGQHTTHFAVMDNKGNAVSATLSVNLPFGSGFTAAGTGVVLNDEMDDFAADPHGSNAYGLAGSQANAVAPGKRPLSSMSPSFIESPTQFAAFGTPGGSRIPSMILLSMLQYLDGQPVATWPAVPRYHHQYLPDVVEYEPGAFTDAQLAELKARGYSTKQTSRAYGNQQVLFWHKDDGKVEAASDPRGVGVSVVMPTK